MTTQIVVSVIRAGFLLEQPLALVMQHMVVITMMNYASHNVTLTAQSVQLGILETTQTAHNVLHHYMVYL